MTKTSEKNAAQEQLDLTKSMTKEAIGIWSEAGEEAVKGEFPESLDITKFQGNAFRCVFVRREDYEYEYDKVTRKGVAYVAKLLKTDAAACKGMEGTVISIYGKGLLNHQFVQLSVKEGDTFVVTCGPKQAISGGREAYQTGLKVVKRA